jgi:hypothetical protein
MSTPDYSNTSLQANYVFGNMQDIHNQLVNNLITETSDPTNSNFCLLNNASGQIVTTPLQLNPSDGDPDDGTTNAYNNNRVATRRWCKNGYLNNFLPNQQITWSSGQVFGGDVRCTQDPVNNNSLVRNSYLQSNYQPLLGGTTNLTVKNLTTASIFDNGNVTVGNNFAVNGTSSINGNIIANSANITPAQLSYVDATSSIQTQLNNKQNVISGSSTVTCGNLTTSSLIDNGD